MYFKWQNYLGFITNPKNGRVKGLNEVSLDRTYLFFFVNFLVSTHILYMK